MNNRYKKTVFTLYGTFFINGIIGVLISQIAIKLSGQIDVAFEAIIGATAVAGMVRIIIFPFIGLLSDKFGRKIFQLAGLFFLIPMLILIITSKNLDMLRLAIIFQALSNVCTDIATYSTLVEVSPGREGNSLSMLVKAFISLGQMIFPIIVSFAYSNNIDYTILIYGILSLIIVNILSVFLVPFPKDKEKNTDYIEEINENESENERVNNLCKPSVILDCAPLIFLGFLILASFSVLTSWLPKLSMDIAHVSENIAPLFSSIYAFGALIGVILNAILVKKFFRPTQMFIIAMALSSAGLIVAYLFPSYETFIFMSIMIGAFASGGMYQLQLSVVLELFPKRKGLLTGINSVVSSIALMFVPSVTAKLASFDINYVLIFNIIITLSAVILSIYLDFRLRKFDKNVKKERVYSRGKRILQK